MTTFSRADLVITPDFPRLPYIRRKGVQKKAVPWGQLKLITSEIKFFTLYWDPQKVPCPVVVYAGAAPGIHIPYLAKLFPTFTFHLYDPREFLCKAHPRVTTYRQLFTDTEAQKWTGRDDVFFISDIRTADYHTMSAVENEEAIMEDMRLQEAWYRQIKPIQAFLKFRLPYSITEELRRPIRYLSGEIFRQPWAPQTSSETRLVPDGEEKEWDPVVYEEQLFYHNIRVREEQVFSGLGPEAARLGLTSDYDSATYIFILTKYLEKQGKTPSEKEILALAKEMMNNISISKRRLIDRRRLVEKGKTPGQD